MSRINYLLILTGLPASGKSTFAQQFKVAVEAQEKLKVKIVDPDKIRKKLYSEDFIYQKENIVRDINFKQIKSALKRNFIVISDDLNYYTSMRHDLKIIADQLKKEFFIISISTPLETCLHWNEIRENKIPREVIVNVYNKFDKFDKYTWDFPFITIDLSKTGDLKVEIKNIIKKIKENIKSKQNEIENKGTLKIGNSEYNKELDTITRRIVGGILQNKSYYSQKNTILKLRKEFIKTYFNSKLKPSEISEQFINFLKASLKLDF